ncbi:hypothetical protein OG746_45340 [Streptomyces sp. NBC_01016]|uniref:hypothetical protein n=1 Tax=Streptomyces sp. NBC_01016 TaxID=2903720 RepID=UPI002252B180|nr:hypothetical protein [Streptomyces sp. NBC_01016]MCX4832314.1 hypothetical protein [Streptomyces sp. NBC_01016]MCX4835938.1 hypothetical protein [Streptomyces sp. NBC_01016]
MTPAHSGRGSGSLISALLPDGAEGPFLVLLFAALIGPAFYGRYKQRRDGTHPPRVNAAVQRGAARVTLCGAVLAEILGLIGIFAFKTTWHVVGRRRAARPLRLRDRPGPMGTRARPGTQVTRSDKWLVVALVVLIMATVCNAVTSRTGWGRVRELAIGVYVISFLAWHFRSDRRKRHAGKRKPK